MKKFFLILYVVTFFGSNSVWTMDKVDLKNQRSIKIRKDITKKRQQIRTVFVRKVDDSTIYPWQKKMDQYTKALESYKKNTARARKLMK